jgi:uncharacterized protein YgbK (DUF1537 family)
VDNLLLAFYADDFTGATDAMEALSGGGARTTLVLDPVALNRTPLPPQVRCVGVAGYDSQPACGQDRGRAVRATAASRLAGALVASVQGVLHL